MDIHHTTPESLETAIAALEQDWALSEQSLADTDAQLDADMDRARARHATTTEGIRAQREGLEIQIQETRLALERQRAAHAKAQRVIQETLGHATLSAILRARIEETCGDLDEPTIEGMVAQALAGLREPATVATPTAPQRSEPLHGPSQVNNAISPRTAQPTASQTNRSVAPEPMNHQSADSSADTTLGGTSSDGPIDSPAARTAHETGPQADTQTDEATSERTPEPVAETALVLRNATPDTPPTRGAGNGKAESTPRSKPANGKASADAVGTKVLTFEEGEVLGQRPGWAGNPFKR